MIGIKVGCVALFIYLLCGRRRGIGARFVSEGVLPLIQNRCSWDRALFREKFLDPDKP